MTTDAIFYGYSCTTGFMLVVKDSLLGAHEDCFFARLLDFGYRSSNILHYQLQVFVHQ